ncbi:MAG: hypothetical protein IPM32_00020 [Ignavibacteriae bacterium]|nr:hypothetical protein [Ignavibacteriota bacterium]
MNHPQISNIIELYNSESQPFRRIHRQIDIFESILKTHTAVIVSDYFRHKTVSELIKGLLVEGLRVPSLGTWQYFSRQIIKEMKKNKYETFIPEFITYFTIWDKKNVDNVINLRNKYAHGATPNDQECEKDLEIMNPILEDWLSAEWLNKTQIELYNVGQGKQTAHHVYLVRANGEKLDLFPILYNRKMVKDESKYLMKYVFFNDLKRKKEVGFLNYTEAVHIRDKEIYEEFQSVLNTDAWKLKTTEEFKERIEELTEVFKGRIQERKQIKEWIYKNDKGYLFLYGNPGVGKSALLAQTFKEIKSEKKNNVLLIDYFIRRGTDYSKPGEMLDYLNKRLEGEFKTGIGSGVTNDEKKKKLEERLRRISKMENRVKVLIFIDGLDEGDENKIINYIINDTYKDILIIYGSRWTREVENFYNRQSVDYKKKEKIKGLKAEDVRAILYEVTDKYAINQEQVEEILKKSEGNPLYLKMLTLAIEEGEIKLKDGIKLPKKIDEFYKLFIERYSMFKDGDYILRSLYTFAAAKDYLTQNQLEIILGYGPGTSERVITALQEVLMDNPSTEEKKYQLFHESMREYLTKEKKLDIRQCELKILDFCRKWKEFKVKEDLLYPLKNYSAHLYNQNEKEELFELIINQEYQKKQIEVTEQYEAGFQAVELGLRAWVGDSYKLIEIGIEAARLHLSANNSLEQIKRWIEEGGEQNYRKALERIKNYEVKDRVILYFKLLNRAADKERNEVVELIIDAMKENLLKDTSLLDIKRVLPLGYIILVTSKLDESYWGFIIEKVEPYNLYEFNSLLKDNFNYEFFKLLSLFTEKTNDEDKVKLFIAASKVQFREGNYKEAEFILESAINISEKIEYNFTKNNCLEEISSELLNQKRIEKSLEIAENIEDSLLKSLALEKVVLHFLDHARIEEAINILDKIDDELCISRIMIKYSNLLFNEGKFDESKEILVNAIEITSNTKNEYEKFETYLAISRELFLQGQEEASENIIDNFANEKEKSLALKDNVLTLLRRGKSVESEKYIGNISDYYLKSLTLTKLAEDLFNTDQLSLAEVMLEDAITAAESIEHYNEKDLAIYNIIIEFLRQGKVEESIKLEKRINDAGLKFDLLVEIITELFCNEDINKALEILEYLKENCFGYKYSRVISEKIFKKGKIWPTELFLEKSIKIVDKIKIEHLHDLIEKISFVLCKQGKVKEVLNLVVKSRFDDFTLFRILNGVFESGKIENSINVIQYILENNFKDDIVIYDICLLLLKHGFFDEVLKFLNKTEIVVFKLEILTCFTDELLNQKTIEQCYTYLKRSKDKFFNCILLLRISEVYFKLGNDLESKKVFNETLINIFQIDDEFDKSSLLILVCEELFKQGKLNESLEYLELIENEFKKSEILHEISCKLYSRGDIILALDIFNKIKDDYWKSISLIKFSGIMFSKGEISKSDSNYDEAIKVINSSENEGEYKSGKLSSIALELAKQGNIRKVFNVIDMIGYFPNKVELFSEIAIELSKQERINEALVFIKMIGNDSNEHHIIKNMAIEFTKHGQFNLAMNLFDLSQDSLTTLAIAEGIINFLELDLVVRNGTLIIDRIQSTILKNEINNLIALRLLKNFEIDAISIFPMYFSRFYKNLGYLSNLLVGALLYILSNNKIINFKDEALLKKLNEVIEISDWLDGYNEKEFNYTNYAEWINDIKDEDNKDQIVLWARKVEKGKMTEEVFITNVTQLIKN